MVRVKKTPSEREENTPDVTTRTDNVDNEGKDAPGTGAGSGGFVSFVRSVVTFAILAFASIVVATLTTDFDVAKVGKVVDPNRKRARVNLTLLPEVLREIRDERRFKPKFMTTRDGALLEYFAYHDRSSWDKTVTFLIHPEGGNMRWMHRLAMQLHRDKKSVFALSMRGHGSSSGERGHIGYEEQYVDDLVDALYFIQSHVVRSRVPVAFVTTGAFAWPVARLISNWKQSETDFPEWAIKPRAQVSSLSFVSPRLFVDPPFDVGARGRLPDYTVNEGRLWLLDFLNEHLGVTTLNHLPVMRLAAPLALAEAAADEPLVGDEASWIDSYSYNAFNALRRATPQGFRRDLWSFQHQSLLLFADDDELLDVNAARRYLNKETFITYRAKRVSGPHLGTLFNRTLTLKFSRLVSSELAQAMMGGGSGWGG